MTDARKVDRRRFLKDSLLVTTGAAALSLEEKILLARTAEKPVEPGRAEKGLPAGKIGKVKISRLICGGNLINGYAHSRNLAYVSSLMKNYFTEEKVCETFKICEDQGINTLVANNNPDENTIPFLTAYRKKGGTIQWLAQVNPKKDDIKTNIQRAIDNGAVGAFIQGGIADNWAVTEPDLIGKVISFIKENGLIAGVGGHLLRVPQTCEKNGYDPDFYFKTLNTVNYHSASPDKTVEFMSTVKKPWIAYKVLGAGVVNPTTGFKYAFKGGADFLCVGMFDFQIKDDVQIIKGLLARNLERKRVWMG